jgi:RNA ligase
MHFAKLFAPDDLDAAIADGFVRQQVHPSMPLRILNYTERAAYERVWTDVTCQCRGLIVHTETGEIVARPWRKFFNYGQDPDAVLDFDAPAEVTDKADGSLGILYPVPDGWAIATRGSFASEQAVHATQLLSARYPEFAPPAGVTVLFEIIYPANRIVLDYGAMDDLVLLGAVEIATGASVSAADVPGWVGPVVDLMPARTFREALEIEPRRNAEGVVAHFTGTGMRIKLKQADYLALHRILTQTTARSVWDYLAVDACRHLISQPKHWGSKLRMDPARAAEILAVGPGWMDQLTAGVPDEFHDWLRTTITTLRGQVDELRTSLETTKRALSGEHDGDRKAIALAIKGHPHAGALFLLLDRIDITTYLWTFAYPPPEKAWGARSEDVA